MKIIKILFFAIITCVMAGCTKESLSPQDGPLETLSLKVETPSAAAESDEDIISDARIIAFRDANTLDANSGMKTIAAGGSITQTVTSGIRDIYVFANESQVQGMTTQLDGVRTLSALQAIQVPYSADIAPPFLSSVKETKTLTDNTSMTANVERTVSKVVLTIKYEWETPNTDYLAGLTIDRVQVKNLPPFSYLIAQPYTQTAYVNSKVIEGADLDNIYTDVYVEKYQSKPLTIYIPEFLGATDVADDHAYLEIVGHLRRDPAITSTYRMPLSSNMAADGTITGTNYDIARNTAFTIDATIKDFGELNQIEIGLEIEAWQTVDSTPEDVGEYLIVAETTKPLKFTIKEDIAIKASDLSKVKISSKNNKLDWTLSGNTISVGVKDEFATDEPQAAIDELIITLGQFTRRVNIDYRPSVAQRFAKGLLVMNGTGGATIGAPNAPFKDVLIFKWGTTVGMRTCDNAGTPLSTAQVAYNPTIHNVSSPQLVTPYIPNTVMEAQYIGRDKDFLNYLHERTELHNRGYGDPCREIGTVGGKKWRTPTASEWDELLSETPKAANLSPGKAIGFGGYVPRQTGTSIDAEFVNNAHYGWFYGPTTQQQTDAANPTKGSVFIYQKYYGVSDIAKKVDITTLRTQNIFSSSASSTAGHFHYYTANDVVGSMGTQTIGDDKNLGNCFAVRCIQQ